MKTIAALLFTALTLPLFALRPGDMVGNPEFKLKWIDCTPFKIGKLSDKDRAVTPPLRVVVFFFTRNSNNDRMIAILEQTRREHRDKLIIAAITPDTEMDAVNFRKKYPDVRIRFAVDSERKLTPLFMAGSMLYPMAFVYDADGKILWSGEAVDLPEAVKNILLKRNNVSKQRKIAILLDEMQQRMRTGEMRPLRQTAEQIFKLDPANPSALRIIMFLYENSARVQEAWELLDRRIAASPATLRLYFTALDMIRRYPQFQKELPRIAGSFADNATSPYEIITFSEALLVNFSSNAQALEVVQNQLCGKKNHNIFADLPPMENIHFHTVLARLRYQLGDLDGAIVLQTKALELFKALRRSGDPRMKLVSNQLDFYKNVKKLQSKIL